MTSMDNTPDSPAKTPEGYTTQGGNFWTLITPEIWKVLHAVLQPDDSVFDGLASTTDYQMSYPASVFVGLSPREAVEIDGVIYQVRSTRAVGDGSEMRAQLTRV